MGRPPMPIDWDFAEKLFDAMSTGHSVITFCRNDGRASHQTVLKWMIMDDEFAKGYARARLAQADAYMEQIPAIADGDLPWDPVYDKDIDRNDPQRDKLRIEARKWLAGKIRPDKYGEKLALIGDEANPITVQHTTPPQRVVEIAKALRKAKMLAPPEPIVEAEFTEVAQADGWGDLL